MSCGYAFYNRVIGFMFLKETISVNVWVAISIAAIGILIMAIDNTGQKYYHRFHFWTSFVNRFCSFFNNIKMEKRNTKIYNSCCSWFILLYFFSGVMIIVNDLNFYHLEKIMLYLLHMER